MKVLVLSAGIIHPTLMGRRNLKKVLSAMRGHEFDYHRSVGKLSLLQVGAYNALIIYLHRQKISDRELEIMDEFVSKGGGLLGVHSASASFKEYMKYFDILGGRFNGHDPVKEFTLEPVAEELPIFGNSVPFTLRDELYRHEIFQDMDVHYEAEDSTGRHPVVWTRKHGSGRVCYFEPGHCAASLLHPQSVSIIQKGLLWAGNAEGM